MAIEGYSSEVTVYDSGGIKNYLRIHYVATESGSGYNVTAQLQVKHFPVQSSSANQTVAAGTSSVSIDGNDKTVTWTSSNTITILSTTLSYQTMAEHTVFVEARESKSIEIVGVNANLAERHGSTIAYNGTASVTFELPKVLLPTNKLYGSVNSQANLVTGFYGSANSRAQRAVKMYGSGPETGYTITAVSPAVIDLETFTDKYYKTYGPFTFRPNTIQRYEISGTVRIYVGDWGLSNQVELFRYPIGTYNEEGRPWGFSSEPVPVSSGSSRVASLTSPSEQSPLAKLIHQGFGHNKYFGKVVYYTDNTYTTTAEALIQSQAEVNSLTGDNTSWTTTINGVTVGAQDIKEVHIWQDAITIPSSFLKYCQRIDTVNLSKSRITTIPMYFMRNCTNFNGVLLLSPYITEISMYFMWNCTSFNQPLPDISGVTSIGYGFMYLCYSFNQPVTIPSTITKIPQQFLSSCTSFNRPIAIPSGITEIGNSFLAGCDAFNQSISIPSTVTKIGDNFLFRCFTFNQLFTIPSSVTSIGNNFLSQCEAFNRTITLPTGITTIGYGFLSRCFTFNQNLSLPNTLTSIGKGFMAWMEAMVGTVSVGAIDASIIENDGGTGEKSFSAWSWTDPAYTTGITIAGANRQAWLDKFPNITSGVDRRKLINAGY